MKQKKMGRKLLSMLMCVSMLFSIVIDSVTVSAANAVTVPAYSDQKADIFYRYMGTSPSNTDFEDCTMPSGDIKDFKWKADDYVWVGVYVRHMPRISSMFAQDGLTNLTVGLLYDSNYLTWNKMDSSNAFSFLDGFNDYFVEDESQKTATYPHKTGSKRNTPFYATTPTDFALSTLQTAEKEWNSLYPIAAPDYENPSSTLHVAQQAIKIEDGATELMFKGDYIKDEEVLVAIYPLKMNANEPPEGTKFLEGTFGPSTFVINSGSTSYNFVIRPEEDAAINLVNKFNIVDNVVNLKPSTYTVTYNAGDGSFKTNDDTTPFDNTESVAEGSKATLQNNGKVEISSMLNPPTDDKVFDAWYTDATGGDRVDATHPLTVTKDTTLYARYTDGYKVTFNLNADNDTTAKFADATNTNKEFQKGTGESIIPAGKTLADLIGATDPTRTDYDFVGWYTKKSNGSFEEAYDETKIGALRTSTVLYAMWKYTGATSQTLTFDENTGDTAANPQTVGYNDGDTLKKLLGGLPQEPTKAGYKFLGWYKNASGDGKRLTADDVLNTYTENNTKTTVYARWGDVTEQPDDPDVTPSPLTPSADAITVHFAKDANDTYNGGTYDYGTVNDKYISEGDPIGAIPTSADMKKDNMKFDGWYTKDVDPSNPTADKGKKVESTTTINDAGLGTGVINSGKVTLYPHWIDKVAVEYDLNGLPGTAPAKVEGLPGEVKFTPPTTTNVTGVDTSKYEIVAWCTKANNDSTASDYKSFTPGTEQTLNDNLKLYAIWNYKGADKVAVTFKGNDSTQKAAELHPNNTTPTNEYTIYRAPQSKIKAEQMPSASRDSYTFNHWNPNKAAAALATPVSQDEITVTGTAGNTNDPMDIYAIWTVANGVTKHTVSFNLNDTTDKPATPTSIASIEVADGDSVGSRMPNNPTRTGFGFKEWQDTNNSNSPFDKNTTVNADVAAKAIWEEEVTVQYNVNGLPGATAPASVTGTPNSGKFTPPTAANVTGVDTTKYEIVAWSTSPNNDSTASDYKSFTPGTEQTLTESLTLYAIWNYTGADKVAVTFKGNDSTLKTATLNPNNTTPTNEYTIYRAPQSKIEANQMPSASRDSYTFNHWNTNKTATAIDTTTTSQSPITVTGTAGSTNDPMDIYAIWTIANGVTPITISYDLNGAKTPTSIDSFTIASGDCVGSRMTTETPTKDNSDFLGWAKSTETAYSNAVKFNVNEALTADTTIKAFFQDKVTITFNANGGTVDTSYTANPSLDDITIPANTAVKNNTGTPKALPKVKKDKYKFLGWFYEDSTSHQLVELKDDSTVTESVTVKAKWKGDIDVNFDQTKFTHDGSAKTPLIANNYTVDLLDQAALNDKTKAEKDVSITGLTISTKYKVKGADNSTATTTAPTNVGVYELVDTTATCSDTYTEYAVHAIPTEFKITAQVSYVVSGNYQYDASKTKTTFNNITIEQATGTSYSLNLDFTNANSDIKVTFTDVSDTTKKFVNQMPNAYGEYSITIEPSENSPYEINQVTDKLTSATNPKLYLICLTRTIKYEFGTQATPTSDTVDVVLPTPSPASNINDVKTTLKGKNMALPVEKTDFTPPNGKRLSLTKPFETRATGDTEGNGTAFTDTTEILWGKDDLVVYALYEDADWTITFKDTKTTDKQNDIVYTVEAGKKISEANAVKKVDGNAPASPVADVASVTKVPENMKFIGWTKTQQIATDALAGNYTAADFAAADTVNNTPAGSQYNNLFTKESLPAQNETKIDVYAIYVKSNDATLKAASFKEILVDKDANGTPTGTETEKAELPYTNADYTTPTTPITFDPDTDTYTIVVENDFEKVLANLEPTQPGSKIKITANGTELTDSGYTSGNRSQKSEVSATTFDGTKNSVNTIVATVTAPDGTTKDYTFNVLRYAEVTMTLEAGNSPYGLIERMGADYVAEREAPPAGKTLEVWDAQKIQDAKDKFDNNGAINKKYAEGYVPDGGETTLKYVSEAWRDYKDGDGNIINYDLDPTALFVYMDAEYKLPGYTITDKFGKEVTDVKPTIKFSVDRQTTAGEMDYDSDTNVEKGYEPKLVPGSTDLYSLVGIMVRMNVYNMTYTYSYTQDNGTKKEIVKTRPIVVISKRGDIILNSTATANDGDVDQLRDYQADINKGPSLVAYRCADFIVGNDANSTPTINDGDVDHLRDNQSEVNASTIQFYKKLK